MTKVESQFQQDCKILTLIDGLRKMIRFKDTGFCRRFRR